MDQFNVMPPVNPAPGQPVHKPSVTTPLPPTPEIPSMTPQQPSGASKIVGKLKYLLILPVFLVLGGIVFGYLVIAKGQTKYGEQLQNDIWQAVIQETGTESKEIEVSIVYEDKGSYDFKPSEFMAAFSPDSPQDELDFLDQNYGFLINNPRTELRSKTYFNVSDIENPQSDFEGKASLSNNSKVFESNLDFKFLKTEAFARMTYNSELELLLAKLEIEPDASDPSKGKWIQTKDPEILQEYKKIVQTALDLKPNETNEEVKKYRELLRDNRLFNIDTLKGMTTIDGTLVLHYSLTLNRDKLTNLNNTLINDVTKDLDAPTKDFIKQASNEIINKINVENYEIWVGATNRKLYKSEMTINAVSVTKALEYFKNSFKDPNNFVTSSLKGTQELSRDAKRIADMRQLGSALELYYNDNNSYPLSNNGVPVGLEGTYVGLIPTAPNPPDGDCNEYYNTYWYTQISPNNYTYTFCLGAQTGGIPAGISTMSEAGIQSQRSFDPNVQDADAYMEADGYLESLKETVLKAIKELNMDATIQINYSAKDFGVTKDVEAPADFVKEEDLYDYLTEEPVY